MLGNTSAAAKSSPTLVSFTVTPASIANGQTYTGKVTLSEPAPNGGTVVGLSENNTILKLPGVCNKICTFSVTVPAGATAASFTGTTNVFVLANNGVEITATLGSKSKSASILVTPGIDVATLSISPAGVIGGEGQFNGTVTIVSPAPAGGDLVQITSAQGGITTPFLDLPITVTIPVGHTSGTFSIDTNAVTETSDGVIFATSGTTSATVQVTVTPK
jgi:hypothetical protein